MIRSSRFSWKEYPVFYGRLIATSAAPFLNQYVPYSYQTYAQQVYITTIYPPFASMYQGLEILHLVFRSPEMRPRYASNALDPVRRDHCHAPLLSP